MRNDGSSLLSLFLLTRRIIVGRRRRLQRPPGLATPSCRFPFARGVTAWNGVASTVPGRGGGDAPWLLKEERVNGESRTEETMMFFSSGKRVTSFFSFFPLQKPLSLDLFSLSSLSLLSLSLSRSLSPPLPPPPPASARPPAPRRRPASRSPG